MEEPIFSITMRFGSVLFVSVRIPKLRYIRYLPASVVHCFHVFYLPTYLILIFPIAFSFLISFSSFIYQYELPNGIEELCWPDGLSWQPHSQDQTRTYTLVLTDLRGQRTFGYCRRIQAEGDDVCSPLAICILTRHSRAKGLFSQVQPFCNGSNQTNTVKIHLRTLLRQVLTRL